MKFNKPHFITSTSNEAREQKDLLISKYGDFAVNDADIFIVLGGDGFMLQAIKDFMDKKIPFFGINYGSIGFLMNSVTDELYDRGREEYLNSVGELSEYLDLYYGGLGDRIRSAESSLMNEKRISLRATIEF